MLKATSEERLLQMQYSSQAEHTNRSNVLDMNNKELGLFGEEIAAHFYEEKHCKILKRNYRTSFGEADIIAVDKDELVFCEVKTRIGADLIEPEEAVDSHKQEIYKKIASSFHTDSYPVNSYRFDVIAISIHNNSEGSLRHIKHAFYFDE